MAKKRVAHKTELWVDAAGGTTFVKLANVKKIDYPGGSRDNVDVTCLDNDIDTGLPSPTMTLGDMAITLYWDEADTAGQGLLQTLLDGVTDPDPAAQPNWKIVLNFATPIARGFHGWVKELGSVSYEVKTEVSRDATIHVTTKPVDVAV